MSDPNAVFALAAWAQHRNTCAVFYDPGTGGKRLPCDCGLQDAAQRNIEAADAIAALQAENGELRKEVAASRFHVNQVGQAHEFLDALSVPESEPDAGGGPPVFLSLAERIAYTAMNDDWDEPSKLVHEILSRSSHPAWHDEQREKAEAERDEALRTVGELQEALDAVQRIVSNLRRVPTDCWGNPDVASRDWPTEEERGRGLARIAEILESASPPPTVEGER